MDINNFIKKVADNKVLNLVASALKVFKYIEIPSGTIEKGKNQVVFVCIYTKNAKPFCNYEGISEEIKNTNIPVVLMQLRTDGYYGFIGGMVDKGEMLIEALLREVHEEINFNLDIEKIEPLVSYKTKNTNIHSFTYEVQSLEELIEIQLKSLSAKHFPSESGGCILLKAVDYGNKKGYTNFLKNNFCETSKIELKRLIESKKLLVKFDRGKIF